MSALDNIAQERQRVSDRLARLDTERAKLAEQLDELAAAERVLSRFSKPPAEGKRRGRPARVPEAVTTTAQPRKARARRQTRPAAARKAASGLSLGDATLRAVEAHGEGISADDVRAYIAKEFGMQVRPNHLGMALQRHRRAGRLDNRDARWRVAHAGEGVAAGETEAP